MCLIYDIMGNGILQFGRNIRLVFLYIRIVVIATSQLDEEGPDWFTDYHTLIVYSRVFKVRDNSIMINEHDHQYARWELCSMVMWNQKCPNVQKPYR